MVKFMQKEMRLLSQYLTDTYGIKMINSTKQFSVSSFFNALDEFMKLAKVYNYEELRKRFEDCYEFLNFYDEKDLINPAKLGDQINIVYISMNKKDGLEIKDKLDIAMISFSCLYSSIEENYRKVFKEQNRFISDDELRQITNHKFTYYLLQGLYLICLKFLSEYIRHVGPGSDRKENIKRGFLQDCMIKIWFNTKCRKMVICNEMIQNHYDWAMKNYQYITSKNQNL